MSELTGIFSEGYGIIPKKIMRHDGVNIYQKAILAYLLSYTGAGRFAWPSQDLISKDLNISKPTVIKALKGLAKIGLLKKMKLEPKNRQSTALKYELVFLPGTSEVNEVNVHVKEVNVTSKPDDTSDINEVNPNNNSKNNNNKNNNTNKPASSEKPLSAHHSLISLYSQLYEKRYTIEPNIGGAGGAAVKRVLERYKGDISAVRAALECYMKSDDTFFCKNSHRLTIFAQNIDAIISGAFEQKPMNSAGRRAQAAKNVIQKYKEESDERREIIQSHRALI